MKVTSQRTVCHSERGTSEESPMTAIFQAEPWRFFAEPVEGRSRRAQNDISKTVR